MHTCIGFQGPNIWSSFGFYVTCLNPRKYATIAYVRSCRVFSMRLPSEITRVPSMNPYNLGTKFNSREKGSVFIVSEESY